MRGPFNAFTIQAAFSEFLCKAKSPNIITRSLDLTTLFQFLMSLVFGTLLFFLSEYISINFFHNSGLIIFLKFFSIAVPINVLLTTMLGTIKAYEKIGWYSFIFNILQNIIKVISLLIFILLGLKSESVIFSYIAGLFVSLILR